MTPVEHFKCHSCGKFSHFFRPIIEVRFEERIAVPEDRRSQQTRDYSCEHCGARNAITLSNKEWIGVEDQAKP